MSDAAEDRGGDLVTNLESKDPATRECAFAQVYDTMLEIARAYLERERKDHTLSPTDVVNEACLRLLGNTRDDITQGHLLGFAAHTMRQVLTDHARRHRAGKRGKGWQKVTLSGLSAGGSAADVDLLALDQAMSWLETHDPELVKLVEWHYFGGMTGDQLARQSGLSRATVTRRLALARALLLSEIDRQTADKP